MMKPGPNYKMSKAAKIYLAQTWSRPQRRARKISTIQAELYSRVIVKFKRDKEGPAGVA